MKMLLLKSRKGVTPIIAVILLLMMTIAIAGLAYVFIQRFQAGAESATENATKRAEQTFKVNLKVEGYNTTCGNASSWVLVRVNVRNSGSEAGRNLQLFVDNAIVNGASNATLGAGVSTSYLLSNESCARWINQSRTVRISSDESDSERLFTFGCSTGTC